jgi:imidazolonepropionase-like amidohydrolase
MISKQLHHSNRSLLGCLSLVVVLISATRTQCSQARPEISIQSPVIALLHAKVVDGLGTAALTDQAIVIKAGRILAIGAAAAVAVPSEAKIVDLTGRTVIPGLVMVHEHLFYSVSTDITWHGNHFTEMEYSFPRLYLACGITTIRTGGSIEPYADLEIKRRIEAGEMPGPRMHLTAPYIEGPPSLFPQFHAVSGPDEATRLVNYWADEGFTSFKLYVHVTPDVAAAAITAAHRRGLQVTGHIGVLTYAEAADLGIDNLEHGFFASNDFVRGKKPGILPLFTESTQSQAALKIDSPECQALLTHLIAKHVAITSTLPVFEGFIQGRPILSDKILTVMSAAARENYYGWWGSTNKGPAGFNDPSGFPPVFAKLMKLEKQFSDEGGMLVAGTDPTGLGNVVAGFGSLREVELLVDAGFTPVQAIKVASLNGARLLGVDKDLGSIQPGKIADLVVIAGDPASSIQAIENIETVFKDGVGYDSSVLIDSVRGCVGIQ